MTSRMAAGPDQLARALTILLDGGLASGALDADLNSPQTARVAAGVLVRAALQP